MFDESLIYRLSEYLGEHGFKYEFIFDRTPIGYVYDNKFYNRYKSVTLQAVTGFIKNLYIDSDLNERTYDIDLINDICKCLMESSHQELINIAWNTFIYCKDDERFILHNEMKEAFSKYIDVLLDEEETSNHTCEFTSERLFIRPSTEKYARLLEDYILNIDP